MAAGSVVAAAVAGCEPPPLCPKNPQHGRMRYWVPGTPEQAFTHIAYHCQAGWPAHCSGSADWPAPTLIDWYDQQGRHEHAASLRAAWQPWTTDKAGS